MVSLGLPTFPPVDSCPLWYMFFCHRAVLQSKVRIGRAVWVGSACAVCVPGRMESDPSHRENASLILHHSFLLTHFFPPWSGYFLSMGQAWTRHPALALVGTLTALWNTEAPSQQYLTEMFQNKTLSSFSKGAKRGVSIIHFWEPSYMESEQLYKLLCVWCGTSQHQRLEVI